VRRQLRDSGPETIQARPSLQDAAKAMVENGLTNLRNMKGSSDHESREFAFFNQQLAGMRGSSGRNAHPEGSGGDLSRMQPLFTAKRAF